MDFEVEWMGGHKIKKIRINILKRTTLDAAIKIILVSQQNVISAEYQSSPQIANSREIGHG